MHKDKGEWLVCMRVHCTAADPSVQVHKVANADVFCTGGKGVPLSVQQLQVQMFRLSVTCKGLSSCKCSFVKSLSIVYLICS